MHSQLSLTKRKFESSMGMANLSVSVYGNAGHVFVSC